MIGMDIVSILLHVRDLAEKKKKKKICAAGTYLQPVQLVSPIHAFVNTNSP